MGDRQRQHAVLAFHRRKLVDEAAHRLARGVEHADHAAVPGRHDGPGAAFDGAFHHGEEIVGALRHVDMRIFLEQHQRGRVAQGAFADVAMEIELGAHRNVRPDDPAHAGQKVAFAVVIALGHHGAVHRQQHAVDRHRGPEVGQDLVAEGFVDLLHRPAGGHGEGAQAFDHLPALGLGAAAPHRERRAEHRHVLAVAAFAVEAGLLEKLVAGGDGGEGVGLGAERGGKDLFHGRDLGRDAGPPQDSSRIRSAALLPARIAPVKSAAARVRRGKIKPANGCLRRAAGPAPDRRRRRQRGETVDRPIGRIEIIVHRQRGVENRSDDMRGEAREFAVDRCDDGLLPLLPLGAVGELVESRPVRQPIDADHGNRIRRPSQSGVDGRIVDHGHQRHLGARHGAEKGRAVALVGQGFHPGRQQERRIASKAKR